MPTFLAQSKNGRLSASSEYTAALLRKDLAENDGARYSIERLTPESGKQRRFYHGAVIPLWAFLNGYDYKDSNTLEWLHHEAKKEFNGEVVMLDGKPAKRGKSTKGALNKGYLERIIDYLEEQYGIDRTQVLNPEKYKDFRDRIYPYSTYDSYIDYLIDIGLLKRV